MWTPPRSSRPVLRPTRVDDEDLSVTSPHALVAAASSRSKLAIILPDIVMTKMWPPVP